MRALIAAALLFATATPAYAQPETIETLIACPVEEQHQFPRNTVGVIWTLRDSNDNSEHMITFTQGGPLLDPAGYAAAPPTAVTGWQPTFAALREAAINRRRVSVQHVGEAIFNVTVLWTQAC